MSNGKYLLRCTMTRNRAAGVNTRRPVRSTEGENMQKLINEVKESIEKEYGRASAKFGLTNHSDHESYAVLLEELHEAHEEMDRVCRFTNEFWEQVRKNESDASKLNTCIAIERSAMLAACELIQVAAMAKKAGVTICNRGATQELTQQDGEDV